MSSLPLFKQLVQLLHWVLVSLNDALAGLGLGPEWSWGLAIIGLTIVVRLILFPLTWRQFSSSQALQAIQPKLRALQKKYKNDRAKLQAETMKLYQEHRINPMASCLPILLQLPVFLSLYYAIRGTDYLDKATTAALANASFLWIPKLGDPDPYYILLIIYVVSQLISTELMLTAATEKSQKMLMRAMPIMFVLFLYKFPAGLFVYWVTTNLWTIGQQLIIRKVMKPVDAAALAARPAKRSRFMAVLAAAQEQRDAREGAAGKNAATSAGATSARRGKPGAGSSGRQPGKGQRKSGAPPGKGQRKSSAPPGKGQRKSGAPPGKGQRKSGAPPGKGQRKSGAPPGTGKRKSGTSPGKKGGSPKGGAAGG